MKIVLFTTDTLHHTYFLRELQNYFDISLVVKETHKQEFPFGTIVDWEYRRYLYEKKIWFYDGLDHYLPSYAACKVAEVSRVKKIKSRGDYDIGIVFGTGKISKELIKSFNGNLINLHGGDPEYYRGLDSHLWMVYHGERDYFTSTIHRVNEEFDDGEVICKIDFPAPKFIERIRAVNTEAVLRLTIQALRQYQEQGYFTSYKQKRVGRYYSAMPGCLKEVCKNKYQGDIDG